MNKYKKMLELSCDNKNDDKKLKKVKKVAKAKTINRLAKPAFKQSRNWCFTDFEILDYKTIWNQNKDFIRCIIVGTEICPTTKKMHIQGFIQFENKKKLGGVKRVLRSNKIHLEACYGTEAQNEKYCCKDSKYRKYGDYIVQGQRTDLEQLKRDIDNFKPMAEVAKHNFSNYIRYHSGIYKYRQEILKEHTRRFRKVEVELITGPTGCGKTRGAFEKHPDLYKITGSSLDWWDGYDGEKTILIDEYSNDVKITKLLNILDGYQLRLPIKGGFTYANWNKVIITTNLRELHLNANPEHIRALYRRITKLTDKWENKLRIVNCHSD